MRPWVAAIVLALAFPARAWEPRLHELLTASAPRGDGEALLEPPTPEELAAFRALVWKALANAPEPARRDRFLALAPRPEAFTAAIFKQLLMLNPTRPVRGIDAPGVPMRKGDLLALASRLPDDDARNQDRFWRETDGTERESPDGKPLPDDPVILEMGGVSGISSQAHAHYQLLPTSERSDSPEVLRHEPWRFSTPREAHTFGADFAAIYDDLATLAAHSGLPHAQTLATLFRGYAFHHAQDACDQIHTVQVGIYDFFVTAQLEAWKEELRTVGGLFGPRIGIRDAGVRILANHHLFLEDFYALQLTRTVDGHPGLPVGDALGRLQSGDERFRSIVLARPEHPFARAAVLAAVEVGSREAPRVYTLAHAFAAPDLSEWHGRDYANDRVDPEAHARPIAGNPALEAAWREFAALQANGFARWGTIQKLWPEPDTVDATAAANRLARLLLAREAESAARRATWVSAPPRVVGLNKGLLTGLASLVVLAVLALRSLVRRRAVLVLPPETK